MPTLDYKCYDYRIRWLYYTRMYFNFNLGDGIYDKLSNAEVIDIVWDTFKRDKGSFHNLH